MKRLASSLLISIGFSVLQIVIAAPLTELKDCTDSAGNDKVFKLSFSSKRNQTGDWVTSFAAYGDAETIPDAVNLDLKQLVTQKNKNETVLLEGTFGLVSPNLRNEEPNLLTGETNRESTVEPSSESTETTVELIVEQNWVTTEATTKLIEEKNLSSTEVTGGSTNRESTVEPSFESTETTVDLIEEQNWVTTEATTELIEEKNLSSTEVTGGSIIFHEKVGINIRLSNNGRTAERINPSDDFNDAIVITNRTLKDNELFEVRLDEVMSMWAGYLDFGVTSKKPTEFPHLTYSSEYSKGYAWFFKTEEFQSNVYDKDYKVGDRFGVMRTPNGDLQYFINGKNIGTSRSKVPKEVYGMIDVYANAVKATIINPA